MYNIFNIMTEDEANKDPFEIIVALIDEDINNVPCDFEIPTSSFYESFDFKNDIINSDLIIKGSYTGKFIKEMICKSKGNIKDLIHIISNQTEEIDIDETYEFDLLTKAGIYSAFKKALMTNCKNKQECEVIAKKIIENDIRLSLLLVALFKAISVEYEKQEKKINELNITIDSLQKAFEVLSNDSKDMH